MRGLQEKIDGYLQLTPSHHHTFTFLSNLATWVPVVPLLVAPNHSSFRLYFESNGNYQQQKGSLVYIQWKKNLYIQDYPERQFPSYEADNFTQNIL